MSNLLDNKTTAIIITNIEKFKQEEEEVYFWLRDKIEQFGKERCIIWQAILYFYNWQLVAYPTPSRAEVRCLINGSLLPLPESVFVTFEKTWQEWFEKPLKSLSSKAQEFILKTCFELSRVFAPEMIEEFSHQLQN